MGTREEPAFVWNMPATDHQPTGIQAAYLSGQRVHTQLKAGTSNS